MTNTANSVDVYRNLHTGTWSVRSRYRQDYGRVIGHPEHIIILDAKFVVLEPGRQKVLREKRKNVHAFVRGEMEDTSNGNSLAFPTRLLMPVTYNPYKMGSFYNPETGQPVLAAAAVLMGKDGKVRYIP
jgi:hypothetical protein